jgi:ribosomal protein L12E/L44/L45/RPP1/RPP2
MLVADSSWLHDAYLLPPCLQLQADNINSIVKAAGITVEPYWPGLFVKLFSKKSIEDLIVNVGAGEAAQQTQQCGSNSSAAAAAAWLRQQQQRGSGSSSSSQL